MNTFFTDHQPLSLEEQKEYDRLSNLLSSCKEVDVFEHEGVLYKGYFVDAVKAFIKNNPFPSDFHVWLQDNYKQL